MNRASWRRLAEARVRDARSLLQARRWAAAYYLTGYAVECGLKACIVVYVRRNPDVIFREKRYSEKSWVHDIEELLKLAGLKPQRDADVTANPALRTHWQTVKDWNEISRYQHKTKPEAENLYKAV